MDKEQVIAALAPLYRMEADMYAQLRGLERKRPAFAQGTVGGLAKEAAQEGDTSAFEAINRRATNKSYFLDGVKAAVEALGIEDADFMKVVNQDRPTGAGDGRKEGTECQSC